MGLDILKLASSLHRQFRLKLASALAHDTAGNPLFLILLSLAVLTPGCVRFQPRPLSTEDGASRLEQRSFTNESFRTYLETNLQRHIETWPLAAWDLTSLTFAAFYYNPELETARAHYASATAGKLVAAERPNPILSVSPAYNTTTTIPSPWLVTASLDVPIETAGKRGYRIEHALRLSEAARYAIAAAAWQVRVSLRRALVELWAAAGAESLLRDKLEAQKALVAVLEKEFAAGALSRIEVTRERVALAETELAVLDAETRRAQARAQVAAAVGVPEAAFANAEFSFALFEQPPSDLPSTEARRRALLNREDVLGALAEYAASESALRLEIAKQYPDIHLSPGYEFDQGDNKWGLGLGVELPIVNRNRGRIAEAEAQRRETAARFNAVQTRVLGEIETALAAYGNARQKVAAANTLLEASKKQQQLANQSFEAGEVDRLVVASARLESTTAALARFETLWKAQIAFGAVEAALHTPLELPASLFISPAEPEHP